MKYFIAQVYVLVLDEFNEKCLCSYRNVLLLTLLYEFLEEKQVKSLVSFSSRESKQKVGDLNKILHFISIACLCCLGESKPRLLDLKNLFGLWVEITSERYEGAWLFNELKTNIRILKQF